MENSTEPELVVFAWGNVSRGDDGIGPLLAKKLRDLGLPDLTVVEDFQLNIEHVMDFSGLTPLLFIDASVAIDSGIQLERIGASEDGNFSTHAISPQALLNVYRESTGNTLPPAFLLHVAGEHFGLGDGLGDIARSAADEAWSFLRAVLHSPPNDWQDSLTTKAVPARNDQ